MKRLTLSLEKDMKVEVRNGQLIIDIPDSVSRDLWKAQFNFWLEENIGETIAISKQVDSGWLRIENNNKLSLKKCRR